MEIDETKLQVTIYMIQSCLGPAWLIKANLRLHDLCFYLKHVAEHLKLLFLNRNFSLLSFGEEAEEDESTVSSVSKVRKCKIQDVGV